MLQPWRIRSPGRRQRQRWSPDEARNILDSAHRVDDPLYGYYVLILALGLHRGGHLQRAHGWLHHPKTETPATITPPRARTGPRA